MQHPVVEVEAPSSPTSSLARLQSNPMEGARGLPLNLEIHNQPMTTDCTSLTPAKLSIRWFFPDLTSRISRASALSRACHFAIYFLESRPRQRAYFHHLQTPQVLHALNYRTENSSPNKTS